MSNNEFIFNESKRFMPGGVNNPVRAYVGMDITPPIIKSGKGVIIKDEDNKEYIDFVLAKGSLILGHSNDKVVNTIKETSERAIAFGAPTALELEMSRFLCENMPNLAMVRMVNSETEATMSVIKLARAFTKKNKILKFAGCYHGHFDGVLAEAGPYVSTEGVREEDLDNMLIAQYNDSDSVKAIFKEYGNDIAAVIVEPVAGNMGVIKGQEDFIKTLRKQCDRKGSLLVFDEVISGFRVDFKGAQSLYTVAPDLVIYSNIIGGGLPCGIYGGRRKIMECLSPIGGIYQAGNMSGNPLVMAAGLSTLKQLYDHPDYYKHIERIGSKLEDSINKLSEKYSYPVQVNRVGGMISIFFTDKEVNNYDDVKKCDMEIFNRYFKHMINRGINIAPSQFEAMFLSTEHNITHVFKFVKAFEEFIKEEKMLNSTI